MAVYIHALKITTDDEFVDSAIGLYPITNFASYPESANLRYLWRMNEGSGTTVTDDVAAKAGTLTAGVTFADSKEKFGKALDFNGTAGAFGLTDMSTAYTSFTIFCKICIRSDGENNAARIWEGRTATYFYTANEAGGFVRLWAHVAYDTTSADAYTAVNVSINTWHTIALVHDGVAKTVKIYVDGIDNTDTAVVGEGTMHPLLSTWTIGNSTSSEARTVDGLIDNFGVYDMALTTANILSIHNLSASPSVIRLIETAPQNATTLTWLAGKIMASGFSSIMESADYRNGGDIAQIGGVTVSIDNSAQLYKTLATLGVALQGCVAEVYEFTDTGSDPGGTRIFYGKVQEIEWNENEYKLSLANGYIARKSNLATVIDNQTTTFADADDKLNNKAVPLTFGEIDKALMFRTANKVTTFSNDLTGVGISAPDVYPVDTFPVTAISSLAMTFKIANTYTLDSFATLDTYMTGKYIQVVSGNNSGQFRKITSLTNGAGNTEGATGVVTANFDKWLPEDYYGSNTSHTFEVTQRSGWFRPGLYVLGETAGARGQIIWFDSTAKFNISDSISVINKQKQGIRYITINVTSGVFQIGETINMTLTAISASMGVASAVIQGIMVNEDTQSFIKIITVPFRFRDDIWPCAGFTDDSGVLQSGTAKDLYTLEDDKYYRIPDRVLKIATGDTDANNLICDVSEFADNTETFKAHILKPITKILFPTAATFADWSYGSYSLQGTDGLLISTDIITNTIVNAYAISNIDYAATGHGYNAVMLGDKSRTTYIQATIGLDSTDSALHKLDYIWTFLIVPPTITDDFNFSKLYIAMDINTIGEKPLPAWRPTYKSYFGVKWRKSISGGYSKEIYSVSETWNDAYHEDGDIQSLPSDYGTGADDANQKYFNYPQLAEDLISGINKFIIDDIDSKEKYDSIYEIMFYFRRLLTGDGTKVYNHMDTIRLNELAMVFEITGDLSTGIYTPVKGRIYNDVWASQFVALRKFPTDVINNPVDVIEHTVRLQNWSEVEAAPAAGWGKAYASAPLINAATTDGGFDCPALDAVKSMKCARQITEFNDAYSDEIIRSLCREFFLASYIDSDGKESIAYLPYKNTDGLTTITLGDIVGEVGNMIEPRPEDIYCEPFVKYKWNVGTQKYDGMLQVTHASTATYSSTYVTGFSVAEEAEAIWDKCHVLWRLCHQVEQPGSDLTELKWVRTEYEARVYLETWVNWMQNRRCKFSVPYVTGRAWHISKRIGIQLPHQTNSDTIECIIEEIERDKNGGVVNVQVIFLDRLPSVEYRVQDTFQDGTLDDWVDSYRTQAEEPTNAADVTNQP